MAEIASTAPELAEVTGAYLEDCQIAPQIPSTVVSTSGVIAEALDPSMAERLWEISERIVGERKEVFSMREHDVTPALLTRI